MGLLNFLENYATEEQCMEKFKEIRDNEGVTCKKCKSKEHYWLHGKRMYQCKKCDFRTSLRSGTVMQNSNLPFRYWFMAMYLMTGTKKAFSAKEVQRQIGHKRYQPIWEMMHKIRRAMGRRDSEYLLEGRVEVDEGFFSVATIESDKQEQKRGRGSQRKTMVLVIAESRPSKKHMKKRPTTTAGHFRMLVMPDLSKESLNKELEKTIAEGSTILCDGYSSYKSITEKYQVESTVTPASQASIKLPWVHVAIGNAKRITNGVFHKINQAYLQNYLDEFCYKLNRRLTPESNFNRLLFVVV